jgi:hypothetical protein
VTRASARRPNRGLAGERVRRMLGNLGCLGVCVCACRNSSVGRAPPSASTAPSSIESGAAGPASNLVAHPSALASSHDTTWVLPPNLRPLDNLDVDRWLSDRNLPPSMHPCFRRSNCWCSDVITWNPSLLLRCTARHDRKSSCDTTESLEFYGEKRGRLVPVYRVRSACRSELWQVTLMLEALPGGFRLIQTGFNGLPGENRTQPSASLSLCEAIQIDLRKRIAEEERKRTGVAFYRSFQQEFTAICAAAGTYAWDGTRVTRLDTPPAPAPTSTVHR